MEKKQGKNTLVYRFEVDCKRLLLSSHFHEATEDTYRLDFMNSDSGHGFVVVSSLDTGEILFKETFHDGSISEVKRTEFSIRLDDADIAVGFSVYTRQGSCCTNSRFQLYLGGTEIFVTRR